jgi:hypothetical protein
MYFFHSPSEFLRILDLLSWVVQEEMPAFTAEAEVEVETAGGPLDKKNFDSSLTVLRIGVVFLCSVVV